MTSEPRASEIRRTLISNFLSSVKSGLEIKDLDGPYDDQFLIRMGQQAEKLDRSASKRTTMMIIADTILLLIILGNQVQIKILGNEMTSFPGVIEIGLFLTSVAYVSSVYRWLNFEIYKGLISSVLSAKYPDCRPEVYMGSLFSTDYAIGLLHQKEMPRSSNKKYFVMIITFLFLLLSLLSCITIFHAITFYLCAVHIWESGVFGSWASRCIVGVLFLTNAGGYFLYFIVNSYQFRFSDAVRNDEN